MTLQDFADNVNRVLPPGLHASVTEKGIQVVGDQQAGPFLVHHHLPRFSYCLGELKHLMAEAIQHAREPQQLSLPFGEFNER